jgi:uncharacterized membrane protein YhiD involved in acid resistance
VEEGGVSMTGFEIAAVGRLLLAVLLGGLVGME